MHLDILAARQANDATGLIAVERNLPILLLKSDTHSLGDDIGNDRAKEEQRLQSVDDALDRDLEMSSDEVRTCRRPEHSVERDTRRTDCRADRRIPWALGDVMFALVAGDPSLDERIERDEPQEYRQHDEHDDDVE